MAQQHSSEEIDLGYLFKKSNDFLRSIVRGLFLILAFFRKFFIVIIILVLVGFAYGYYKDLNAIKAYNNEVIVIPNFESVDYLYDKVEAVNKKIAAGDSIYLKQILDTNYTKLNNIEIEPIADIYNFVSKSYRNFDVLRLIAEKQDFSEYMEDLSTSKYFKYHRMAISITGKDNSEKIITDLFAFLNENEHLKKYQAIYVENNKYEIKEHYEMIDQIDSVLMSNTHTSSLASNVSINNSTDLYNLVEKKRQLLEGMVVLKMEEIDYSDPIKMVSADYNIEEEQFLSISNKIKYPLLLVFFFSLIFFVIYIFKRLRAYSRFE